MKALQLVAHGNPGRFELRDLADPKPPPDEVVVQIHACGLNHLDLWLEQAGLPISVELPRTPGGEVAGHIIELGAEVDEWRLGDRVAIQSSLRPCRFCLSGRIRSVSGELLGVNVTEVLLKSRRARALARASSEAWSMKHLLR
jgi:NADPH:quinone reductase-like Zn-dependent oxidoreductase